MKSIGELREKRREVADLAARLVPPSGVRMSDAARKEFDDLMREEASLATEIRRLQHQDLDADLRRSVRPLEDPFPWQGREYASARRRREPSDPGFDAFLRRGDKSGCAEFRDMGVGSPTASIPTSVLVPQGFMHEMEVALKYYGPMLEVSRDEPTPTGAPLPWPTTNDSSIEAELVGEGQQVDTQDLNVGNIVFGAYKLSTKLVKVSLELLQDSAFPLESYLVEQFAIRLGRKLNNLFTVGTGSSEPTGFLTAATEGVGGSSGISVIGDDNATSPDPATEVGYLDLVNLEHSVDIAYRKGAIFMAHDSTIRFIQSLKDKFGRPLFGSVEEGQPYQILGYPIYPNNDLDTLALGSPDVPRKTLAFGQFQKYVVRRVKDMAVLRLVERFAELGQVGFLGFARYDGNLLDAGTHPIKYLTNPS
jgi:HK97 family phage major capsid protein